MKFLSTKDAKAVNAAVNPILIVSKLAAVCTVIRDPAKDEFVTSRLLMVVQVLVSVVSILHLVFIPYAVIYLEMMPKENTTAGVSLSVENALKSQGFITKMTNIILISTAAITVRISSLFQMHRILPNLLKCVAQMDRMIPGRNNDSIWILTFSVILILASWPYQMYSILMVTTKNWIAFLMFYLNLYNNFSIITCEFQFVSLCWILKTRFGRVIDELKDLELKIFMDVDESILGKITRIKEYHRMLAECCAKLNALYAIPLFAILGSLTLNILFTLYFAIFGGFKRDSSIKETDLQKIGGSMDYIVWSLYYFSRFVMVCMAAGRLVQRVNSVKRIVCNLFHKSLGTDIKQEIWIYLAYLTSNEIRFNACGFFNIDVSLITSAVSTGATYLVILAQFQSRR